jgi:hypothetical protein
MGQSEVINMACSFWLDIRIILVDVACLFLLKFDISVN